MPEDGELEGLPVPGAVVDPRTGRIKSDERVVDVSQRDALLPTEVVEVFGGESGEKQPLRVPGRAPGGNGTGAQALGELLVGRRGACVRERLYRCRPPQVEHDGLESLQGAFDPATEVADCSLG